MLSKKQLADVCMLWNGSLTCRYLNQDEQDPSKWCCLRHRPIEKAKIDDSVTKFFKDAKKKGIDPYKAGVPIGDNCSGYPFLKHVEQGYDKD